MLLSPFARGREGGCEHMGSVGVEADAYAENGGLVH